MAIDEARWRAVFEDICPSGRFVSAQPITGGVSAETVVIEYRSPDGVIVRIVGRRHGAADLARNPRIADDELKLLHLLQAAGIAVPTPIGVSNAGEFPAPAILSGFINGTPTPPVLDHPERAAALLAQIHCVSPLADFAFLPRRDMDIPPEPALLDRALDEARIRGALVSVDPLASPEATLLHGDFWPGNLLWREDGDPVAIDWEDAGLGDPLADLANARLEWRLTHDASAATQLTERYRALTGHELTTLPWWDLRAALSMCGKLESFGLEPAVEHHWRDEHRRFVDEAIEALVH